MSSTTRTTSAAPRRRCIWRSRRPVDGVSSAARWRRFSLARRRPGEETERSPSSARLAWGSWTSRSASWWPSRRAPRDEGPPSTPSSPLLRRRRRSGKLDALIRSSRREENHVAEALLAPAPEAPAAKPRPRRRRLRIVGRTLAILAGLLVVAGGGSGVWLHNRMEASLPQLDGELALAGLSSPVEVERDDLGVPTIHAANRVDAARALGFLHGQDRFFQMDLLRRQAAGELAELVGRGALEVDRAHRRHRLRDVARRIMAAAKPEDKALLGAYAEGVNAGLAGLGAEPFEYLALRADPAPWLPEDSILAVYAMFFELHDETGGWESDLGVLHDMMPEPMFEFLTPTGTEWDAPLVGEAFAVPPIPGPEVFDLHRRPALPKAAFKAPGPERWGVAPRQRGADWEGGPAALGSNNWAVAGSHTADGRAL